MTDVDLDQDLEGAPLVRWLESPADDIPRSEDGEDVRARGDESARRDAASARTPVNHGPHAPATYCAPEYAQRNAALGLLTDADAAELKAAIQAVRDAYEAAKAEIHAILDGEDRDHIKVVKIRRVRLTLPE